MAAGMGRTLQVKGDELEKFETHLGGRNDALFMAGTATSLLEQKPIARGGGPRWWASVGASGRRWVQQSNQQSKYQVVDLPLACVFIPEATIRHTRY